MTRAEFIEYFEAVWQGNSGETHHSKKNLDDCWEICIDVLHQDGEEVDWNWKPTKQEVKYYCSWPDLNV